MKKLLLLLLFPFLTYGQVQIGEDIIGESPFDASGSSISISSDGTILVIGAEANSDNGNSSGHMRVYENNGGIWIQIGQDIDGESSFDRFGSSVSISSDGTIIAIGATGNDENATNSGHIRIFENIDEIWTQIGQDIDGESEGDSSGSVSLSSDGNIVAIGAFGNDGNGSNSGHVRVYENQGGIWTQIGQDIDGESEGDFSGSVSLSSDGNIVAIGAPGNDGNGIDSGHVRIYENINGAWTQIGQDIDGEEEINEFGRNISLSSNGSIIAIGSIFNNGNGNSSGHVRVFENINENWIQIGQDIDGEVVGENLGSSVSLSSDGTILVIGASNSVNANNESAVGRARIYKNQGGNWIQIGQDIIGDVAFDLLGESVSISDNGSIVAVGAPQSSNGNPAIFGYVRVYDLSALLSTKEFIQANFSLYPNPASTQITIDVPQGNMLEKATIYNHLGQLVLSSKSTTIDTSALSKGMYIVEVLTNQGASSKKLIIE